MKNLLLIIVFISYLPNGLGQNISKQQPDRSYYIQKSRNQKTIAWILLGGGTATAAIAFGGLVVGTVNDLSSYRNQNNHIGATIVTLAGFGSMLASIPVFISAGKNKRRAASITFGNMKLPIMQPNFTSFKMQTGISIKFFFE